MAKLSNKPYKGCSDYAPGDYKRLEYILNTFRKVCKLFAYEEYLTPVLESAEIYEAKSGEDIGKELYRLTDSGNRRLCLRPEMTPSVTRLVTQFYNQVPKPIRLFSIANFFRGERPQKGRMREFWQLNADIFGEENISADIEIISLSIEIMLAFKPPKNSFVLKINNRKLIDYFFSQILNIEDAKLKIEIIRKMDKFNKLERDEFSKSLLELGLDYRIVEQIKQWMSLEFLDLEEAFTGIVAAEGFRELKNILDVMTKLGYGDYIQYSSDLIRGFDYYDGIIFEMFDLNPEFKRSIFGGGRYNGLAGLFVDYKISAVGFAPGDVAISIFLDNWNLWPDFDMNDSVIYFPVLDENLLPQTYKLAQNLRQNGQKVEIGTRVETISKALSYATKRKASDVIILGTEELAKGVYKTKNLANGEESENDLD